MGDIEDADRLADKLWTLRILEDEVSAADTGAPFLVVSQFTLYADTRKGRRPSWSQAAPRAVSEPLVESFVEALAASLDAVSTSSRTDKRLQDALKELTETKRQLEIQRNRKK